MADPRCTWTPGALSHDRGGRRGGMYAGDDGQLSDPSGVYWSPVMREAAIAVLALPVGGRGKELRPVAGELEARAA